MSCYLLQMIKSNMFPDQTKVIYPQNCFLADDFDFYIMDCESAKNIAMSLIVPNINLAKMPKISTWQRCQRSNSVTF